MRRRNYLIGTATVIVTSVAGCTGNGDGGESDATTQQEPDTETETTETETTETETTTTTDQAQQHYEDAVTALVDNAKTLDGWTTDTSTRDQQAITALRDNLERARESLDAADETASDGFADRIGHVRDVATFQESLVGYHELALEFETALADASEFVNAEQHERAVEQYEKVKGILDQVRNHLGEVETAHGRIDTDAFDAPDPALDYGGEYTQFLDINGPEMLDAQELSIDGQMYLNQTIVELDPGFQHWENEEFAAAGERFDAAAEAIRQSREALEAIQDHDAAWESLRQRSTQLLEVVTDVEEAVGLFVDAATEVEDGNVQEATELMEEGFSVFEQAFE